MCAVNARLLDTFLLQTGADVLVVHKPINANPRLKLHQGFNFSCWKCFQKLILSFMCQVKVETKGQNTLEKSLFINYLIGIKIDANPELA